MMKQVQDLIAAKKELAQVLGGRGLTRFYLSLLPTVDDVAEEEKAEFENKNVWSRTTKFFTPEAAERKKQELIDLGFKFDFKSTVSDEDYYHFSSDGISLSIYFKPSKEDECAALKRRLAELGCHY